MAAAKTTARKGAPTRRRKERKNIEQGGRLFFQRSK